MASPHPTEGRCVHQECSGPIIDIWTEFLETREDKAAVSLGKADFTCPYCSRPFRFDARTNRIIRAQSAQPFRYHYQSAILRAACENTSIFGLMREKGMVRAGVPAFLGYEFKDRREPLTHDEGEVIHKQEEISP